MSIVDGFVMDLYCDGCPAHWPNIYGVTKRAADKEARGGGWVLRRAKRRSDKEDEAYCPECVKAGKHKRKQ